MNRVSFQFIIILLIGLLCLPLANANNRFNVFTYADDIYLTDQNAFYQQLDDFGASSFLTYQPDSSAKYKMQNSLNIDLFTNHWCSNPVDFRIFLNNANTVHLSYGAVVSINARMNGANNDDVDGYLKNDNDPQYIGKPDIDESIDRGILYARVGEQSQGFLHPKFKAGIFHRLNKHRGVENVTYEGNLRPGSLAGPSSTVVAQLIMENSQYSDSCDINTTSPYKVIRYNDTLLIVGTASGLDTVPTIDRTSDTAKTIYYPRCWCATPSSIKVSGFKNVCYRDVGNNIICVFPYRSIKDIHVSDFVDTTHYKKFTYSATSFGEWSSNWYKVYWPGNRTVYLDSFSVYNEMGVHYDKIAFDSTAMAKAKIESYYDTHVNVKNNINGFYIMDEPAGASIQTCGRIKNIVDALGSDYPKIVTTTLGSYNNTSPNSLNSKYYDTYIRYSGNPYFMVDHYINNCYLSSSSYVHDSTSIQWAIENHANKPKMIEHLKTARARCDSMSPPTDFWLILPSYAAYSKCDTCGSIQYVKTARQHTKEEMRMLVNLGLLYGAKGVGYWLYSGRGGTEYESAKGNELMPIDSKMGLPIGWDTLSESEFTAMLPSLCSNPPCSCITAATPPYIYKGLVHKGADGSSIRYPHWYEVKEINQYLDSMAYFFLNADWLSAGRWTDNLGSMSGSFIDSIKTRSGYDSAYIQVGFFSKTSENYAYILNRRCDNGTFGHLDTQSVRIYFGKGNGVYEISEIYNNSVDTLIDSCGIQGYDIFLQPGEAKLIKRKFLRSNYWKGALTQNWTWPAHSLVNITGDLTINAAKTLSIKGGVKLLSNYDSLNAGFDPSKVELIVNGNLRIDRGSGPYVIFSSGGDLVGWWGIRTTGNGKAYINGAEIRNASMSFEKGNNNADTILNTQFEYYDDYAVRSVGYSNLRMDDCDFGIDTGSANGGYYGLYLENANSVNIDDCQFWHLIQAITLKNSQANFNQCSIIGDYGISVGISLQNSTSNIFQSQIINQSYGINIDGSCNIDIDNCAIYSDDSDWPIEVGIDGSGAAANSVCKIRRTCFKNIHGVHVHASGTGFDLGTAADSGMNNFYDDVPNYDIFIKHTNRELNPAKALNPDPGGQVTALNNYYWFSTGATCPSSNYYNMISGNMSGAVSYNLYLCQEAQLCYWPDPGVGRINDSIANSDIIPNHFSISQNYPNPFNPVTTIEYATPKEGNVIITIYNILGQRVRVLQDGWKPAGAHMVIWDSKNDAGQLVSSGVYFYKLDTGDYSSAKKMIILK